MISLTDLNERGQLAWFEWSELSLRRIKDESNHLAAVGVEQFMGDILDMQERNLDLIVDEFLAWAATQDVLLKPSGRSDRAAMPSQAGLAGSADFAAAPNTLRKECDAIFPEQAQPSQCAEVKEDFTTSPVLGRNAGGEVQPLAPGDPNAACRAAFARGERIQVRKSDLAGWRYDPSPEWISAYEYRIAPTQPNP